MNKNPNKMSRNYPVEFPELDKLFKAFAGEKGFCFLDIMAAISEVAVLTTEPAPPAHPLRGSCNLPEQRCPECG